MAESKENALVAYDPDCLRKRSNWGKSGKRYRFDTPEFDPAAFLETMRSQSPKLYSLLTKIDLLDARDMAKDGRRYKHFIFSDVRANSAGAKMLASALIARGWTLGYKAARLAEGKDKADDKKPKKKKYGKIELLSADTLHKTRYENFYLLASTGVYDQPISVATKKSILQRFNSRPDNVHGEQARIIVMDSGFKEGIDLFDIRYVHIFEPSVTAADQQQIIGRGTRLCGQKGLKFHPTLGWPLYVFIYDVAIPEELRGIFLDQATLFDAYLRAMNMDVRLYRFANDLEKVIALGAVDYDLNRNIHLFQSGTAKGTAKGKGEGSDGNRDRRMTIGGAKTRVVRLADGSTKTFIIHDEIPPLVVEGVTQRLGHAEMRNMIKRNFSEYAWAEVKMENGCAISDADSVPDFAKKIGQLAGPSTNNVIQFTPTQNFVRHYFTPQCAVKGMLLWHGVGTGKTCSAIATATTSFEPQGYTILWVTRTTLKNDIWKNMFDQVCNAQFQQKMAESGYVLPTDPKARMRALSKAWRIRPMSYKQFSNLVSKQNQMYKTLVKINGEADPLRKTLLVIDEAHKLYGGGDLSSLERPDMDALHQSIMHSYRVSGRDSVRLLLMTATPITQTPMEIIQLLNLCKPADAQIPYEFDAFSQDYLNDVGGFTVEGRRQFLDNIAGYISYLNREKDARQFAQISIERIESTLVRNVAEVERFDKRLARETLGKEVVALKNKVLEETAKIDADLLDVDSGRFAFLKSTCDEVEPAPLKKACIKVANWNIRELVSEIKVHTKKLREDIKVIRGEVKNKNLFRRETLKRISDTLAAEPVEYAKFQESIYYQLKSKCANRVKGTGVGDEAFAMHPQVQELTEQLATYDDRIARLNGDLDGEMAVHKARVAQIRTMMRSGQLNDLEKSTLKLSLKDIRKTAKKTKRDLMKIVSGETKTLNTSRKEVAKRRKKVYARLRKTLKTALKEEAAKEKEEARVAKKLRKTLRKEGRIREEMKNELLVDLVGKYEKKIVREVEDGRLGVLAKAAAKAEEKELKAEVKAELKKMKAEVKADAREKKAREKAVVKAQEKEKKAEEKALAKRERETRRAQEKEAKKAAKIAARKTKKNLG